MTHDERIKFAYKTMLVNNPDEVVKVLIMQDKKIKELEDMQNENLLINTINERLFNILNEIKNMCKKEYYERNTTDIDSIGLSNNICVMIYMKIKELMGDLDE